MDKNKDELRVKDQQAQMSSTLLTTTQSKIDVATFEGTVNVTVGGQNSTDTEESDLTTQVAVGFTIQDATFNGPVTVNVNPSISSSVIETEIGPIWFNVQDPIESFCGREQFLDELHEKIQNQRIDGGQRVTVLSQVKIVSGLGGVGKTETARMYIHRYKKFYESYIWINAESENSIRNSFMVLAERKLNMIFQSRRGMVQVEDILDEIYAKICVRVTLLVFDNAENFLADSTTIDPHNDHYGDGGMIKPFLPNSVPPNLQTPFILVTSRNQDWGPSSVISLDVFMEQESVTFILIQLYGISAKSATATSDDDDDTCRLLEDAKELACLLGHLPLALQQAVAFIKQQEKRARFKRGGGKFTIRDYIEEFQSEQNNQRKKLLKFPPFESSQQTNFSSTSPARGIPTVTVYTTWNVTLKRIEETENGLAAIQVIQILAFLYADDVPADLLLAICMSFLNDEDEMIDGLLLLEKYAMIKTRDEGAHISIHRQVQQVILEGLREEEEKNLDILTGILAPAQKFLGSLPLAAETYGTMLTNLLSVSNNFVQDNKDGDKKSGILTTEFLPFKKFLGLKFNASGKYQQARHLLQQAYDGQSKILGPSHLETLQSRYELVNILQNEGSYQKASSMATEILNSLLQSVGPNHPDTIKTMHSVALQLKYQTRYTESMDMFGQALALSQKNLGPDHLETLRIEHNIALLLQSEGKYGESIEKFQKVYQVSQKKLGPDHALTLRAMHNTALVLKLQGDYESAMEMYENVYALYCKILGPEHPDSLAALGGMAIILQNQNKFEEALEKFQKVLDLGKNVWGPHHPLTLVTLHQMALVRHYQGENDEALKIFAQVFDIWKKTVGLNHAGTMRTRHNMALVLSSQGKCEEAMTVYEEVLDIRIIVLGVEHPETMTTIHNIARLMVDQGRVDEGVRLYRDIYEVQKRTLGRHHLDTVRTAHNLAAALDLIRNEGARGTNSSSTTNNAIIHS